MRHALIAIALGLLTFSPVWAEVTEVELAIDGLSCPFCVLNIEKPLKRIQALDSLRTNYQEGLVELKVKPDQPVELGQLKQAVAETGFTLRRIRLTVLGTLGDWKGNPILISRGTDQRFLLHQGEAGALKQKLLPWRSAGTLVKVTGPVHEHQGLPPAISVESIEEAKR